MKLTVAKNVHFDHLIFDGYTDDDFAHSRIGTLAGTKVRVPRIASLMYRGSGWMLTPEGKATRFMPEIPR